MVNTFPLQQQGANQTVTQPQPSSVWPCPSCGHCPTCGRGGQTYTPGYYPYITYAVPQNATCNAIN